MAETYHAIPRVLSEYPMGLCLPAGASIPIRMRDDLDPYSPPAEYADGHISWSGYATRDARDAARIEQAVDEEHTRQQRERARAKRRAEAEQRIRSASAEAIRLCDHTTAVADDDVSYFTGSVAVAPYTEENRAAHGNVKVMDHCPCGAARARLVNGKHEEIGPWRIDDKAVQDRVSREVR